MYRTISESERKGLKQSHILEQPRGCFALARRNRDKGFESAHSRLPGRVVQHARAMLTCRILVLVPSV